MTDKKETTNIENTEKKESVKSVKNAENKKKINFDKLKDISFSKPFIASIFLLAGIGGTLLTQSFAHKIDGDFDHFSNKELRQDRQIEMLEAWQKEVNGWMKNFHDRERDRSDRFFDDFYSDSFDPFSDMENIHKRMRERFSNFDRYFDNHFKGFKKPDYSKSSRTSVSQKEDKNYIYYHLNFKGFDKDDISVKIDDKILSFAAKKMQDHRVEDEKLKSRSKVGSNFLYSFSIPDNVDLDNPEIVKGKNKITVKFKKD